LEIKHLNAIDGIMRTKKGSIVSIAEGDDIVFGELGRLRPDHPQMPLKHVPLLSCRGRKLDQARRRPLGASISYCHRRGMVRPKALLGDGQRPPKEPLGLAEAVGRLQHFGEVVRSLATEG
jgi:hypothetical protein